MKEKEVKLKKMFWQKKGVVIGIFAILLVLIIALFNFAAISSNKNKLSEAKNAIDIQDYVSLEESQDNYKTYTIKLEELYKNKDFIDKMESLDEVFFKYKLGDNNITLKLYDSRKNDTFIYDLNVNGEFVYKDYAEKDPKIVLLKDFIIFKQNKDDDTRELHLYVFQKNGKVKEIYELDSSNKGMRGNNFTVTDEGICIEGSRVQNDTNLFVNGTTETYNLTDENEKNEAFKKHPDLIVKALYTYKFRYGVLTVEPEISEEVTLTKYLRNDDKIVFDIQDYVSLEESQDNYKVYTIKIKKLYEDKDLFNTLKISKNIVLKYKIGDYNVSLKLHDDERDIIYDLSVNDKYIYKDTALWDPKISLLGDYLIFKKTGVTDIRGLHLYIYQKDSNVNEIYELDSSEEGMRGTDYNITNDGISIKGMRIYHNYSVYYQGEYYGFVSKESCEKSFNVIPDDYLVEALYTYKYENGVLSMKPEISERVTFKEHADEIRKNSVENGGWLCG